MSELRVRANRDITHAMLFPGTLLRGDLDTLCVAKGTEGVVVDTHSGGIDVNFPGHAGRPYTYESEWLDILGDTPADYAKLQAEIDDLRRAVVLLTELVIETTATKSGNPVYYNFNESWSQPKQKAAIAFKALKTWARRQKWQPY